MDYVFISYQTKDDSGNSKDVSDDEKAQLKSQAEAIASGLKEGGDLNALAEEQGATVQTLTFDKDTTSPDEDLIKAADEMCIRDRKRRRKLCLRVLKREMMRQKRNISKEI